MADIGNSKKRGWQLNRSDQHFGSGHNSLGPMHNLNHDRRVYPYTITMRIELLATETGLQSDSSQSASKKMSQDLAG